VDFVRRQSVGGSVEWTIQKGAIIMQAAKRMPGAVANDTQALLNKANHTLGNLRHSLSVEKAIDAVAPTVDLAKQKYIQAHDAIVAAPVYKQAYNTSSDVLTKVQTTPLYQNVYEVSAKRLYPAISPYADPLVEKAQPFINTVFEQLKPITAAA